MHVCTCWMLTCPLRLCVLAGWPTSSSNMKVLTDDGKGPFPTRETIVNALQWLTHGAKAGDSLFLQISGQGDSVCPHSTIATTKELLSQH